MELPIAFYGLLFLYHLTLWLLKSSSPQSKNKYPGGPKPLGIIGNFFTLRRLQTRPDWELMNIARKWGDLCLLWAGRHPVIIVNKPQAIKNLLVDVRPDPVTHLTTCSDNLQRGVTYSSRPEPNNFRSSVWPWRLVIIPAGKTFRFLRKLYHDLLSLERSLEIRKYQDDESIILLSDLLNQPSTFLKDIERYSLSVIFTAVYGLRVGELDHPIVVELFHLWDLMLQRVLSSIHSPDIAKCIQTCSQARCLWTIFPYCRGYHCTFNQVMLMQPIFGNGSFAFTSPSCVICKMQSKEGKPLNASANGSSP